MRLTFLAVSFAASTMTACGKPNQALPEQEKDNFAKIIRNPAAPAEPDSAAGESTGDSAEQRPFVHRSQIDTRVESAQER